MAEDNQSLLTLIDKSYSENMNRFLCELEFNEYVLGPMPKNEEVMRQWLETKFRREAKTAQKNGCPVPTPEQVKELIDQQVAEVINKTLDQVIDDAEDVASTTFYYDEKGYYLRSISIKACLRDIVTTLGYTRSKQGCRQNLQHISDVWLVDADGNRIVEGHATGSERVYFYRVKDNGDEYYLSEPDEQIQKTARVSDAAGSRSVVKLHDALHKVRMRFELAIVSNLLPGRASATLRDKDYARIFAAMQDNGLGACRSQGYGKFKLIRCDKLTKVPWVQTK